jgi:hypothetical protein
MEVPEEAVVDEQELAAGLSGALEQLAVRRDAGDELRDLTLPGDLKPIGPVVLPPLGVEQVVAEPNDLLAAGHVYDVPMPEPTPSVAPAGSFLDSLMDTELYSIGAYFCDEHPDLVDEVVARSEEIERQGLEPYSRANDGPIEESFETLLTGLAVRYYKAVAG